MACGSLPSCLFSTRRLALSPEKCMTTQNVKTTMFFLGTNTMCKTRDHTEIRATCDPWWNREYWDLSTMGKTRETARKFARHATLGEIENSKTKIRVTYPFSFQLHHAERITAYSLLSLSCILSFTHQSVAKTNYTKNNNDNKINPFGFLLKYSGQFFLIFVIITAYLTQDWISSFPYVLV